MKKSAIIGLVMVVGLLLTGAVYAWWPGGGYGMGYGTSTNVETMKKFQKETLSLRDDLMTKQLELQNEHNKPVPDTNRITTLKKEIIDLQAKIQAVAEKYGVNGPRGGHMGGMMMGRGMMGQGMMGTGMCGCPMCSW